MSNQAELTDQERLELRRELDALPPFTGHRTLAHGVRGGSMLDLSQAVFARIPSGLDDADVSVCGVKGFMIDELIAWGERQEEVVCAAAAKLEIIDSPEHAHGLTEEFYIILAGEGYLLCGEEVRPVKAFDVVLIPPGVAHGLATATDKPVQVLLIFRPGLAPKDAPRWRDERIVCERTSERLQQVLGQPRLGATISPNRTCG